VFLSRAAGGSCQSSAYRIIKIWSAMIRLGCGIVEYSRISDGMYIDTEESGVFCIEAPTNVLLHFRVLLPPRIPKDITDAASHPNGSSLDSVAVPPPNLLQEPCYHSNLVPSLPFFMLYPKHCILRYMMIVPIDLRVRVGRWLTRQ